MLDPLNRTAILATFDDLRKQGKIVYGESEAILLDDGGLSFQFRICHALSKKPQLQDEPETTETRTFGPGSDLEFGDERLLIATINETHHFILNKFCVFRPQYILLTTDSYRRQDEPLDFDDFQAVLDVSARLQGHHYALYNCMEPAGSSRRHKHLQIFDVPADFSLFPDRHLGDAAKVPYRYFLQRFGSASPSARELLDIYKKLLSDATCTLSTESSSQAKTCPHNVVLVKEWMLVIPRRKSNVNGVSANGAGMLGMVWVTDEAKLEQWKSLGPRWTLSQLGVAQDQAAA